MCLDVLRAMQREPGCRDAFMICRPSWDCGFRAFFGFWARFGLRSQVASQGRASDLARRDLADLRQSRSSGRNRFRIEHHVFDGLAEVRVGDVDHSVGRLNDGGVGMFSLLPFERQDGLPVPAVPGDGHIEHFASGGAAVSGGVVVNEQLASVFECHTVDASVGVGQFRGAHLTPGSAAILRPELRDHALLAATQCL